MKKINKILCFVAIITSTMFIGCDKENIIPIITVDVYAYGENSFDLSVGLDSWNDDNRIYATYDDSTTLRLTYVQVPDELSITSNGNRIVVYSNDELCIDTSFTSPVTITVPIVEK